MYTIQYMYEYEKFIYHNRLNMIWMECKRSPKENMKCWETANDKVKRGTVDELYVLQQ